MLPVSRVPLWARQTPLGTGTLVAKGTFWIFVQVIGSKTVMLGGQVALAWLLSKEDFGQIAMAYTVTALERLEMYGGDQTI